MSSESRPPTFLETMYDPDLSTLFLRCLMATGNESKVQTFHFLRRSLHILYLHRPHRETVDAIQRLFLSHICVYNPSHIEISQDLYDHLCRRIYDAARSRKIDNSFYADVNEECTKALRPDFETFIKDDIWKQVSSFEKIQQPTVPVVARHRTLRAMFQAFMEKHTAEGSMAVSSLSLPSEEDGEAAGEGEGEGDKKKEEKKGDDDEATEHVLVKSEEIAPGLYSLTSGLWDFVVKAEKLRENHELEATHGSSSTGSGAHGDAGTSTSSKDLASTGQGSSSAASGTDGKSAVSTSDSDNAKRLYKKFKKLLPVKYNGEGSLSNFLLKTLDNAIRSIRQSSTFLSWIDTREWENVTFPFNVTQTFQRDGIQEFPTLAAALTGSLERLCCMFYPESAVPIQFMKEVLGYMQLFSDPTAAAANKKTIKNSAKSIYQHYFVDQIGILKFPKEIVEEVKASTGGLSSSKLTQHLFQKAASWIYYRGTFSWFREFQASNLWTIRDYNNNSAQAVALTDEFNRECITGIPLALKPEIDDVVSNPRLFQSFCEYLPQSDGAPCVSFLTRHVAIHSAGKTALPREEAENMMVLLSTCMRNDMPMISGLYRETRAQLDSFKSSTQTLATSPFDMASVTLLHYLDVHYLANWIEDCQGDFESIPWEPAVLDRVRTAVFIRYVQRAENPDFIASLNTAASGGKSEVLLPSSEASGSTEPGDGLSAGSEASKKGKRAIKKPTVGDSAQSMLPDGSQSGNEVEGARASSHTSLTSVTPRIPKIEQTLKSTLLRQLFEEQVLQTSLSEEEMEAWHAFSAFYARFTSLKDEQFTDEQEEMRKEAQEIFDNHWKLMRNSDYIRSRLSKTDDFITPFFFIEEESKMFAPFHAKFEGVLRHAGWKPQN